MANDLGLDDFKEMLDDLRKLNEEDFGPNGEFHEFGRLMNQAITFMENGERAKAIPLLYKCIEITKITGSLNHVN